MREQILTGWNLGRLLSMLLGGIVNIQAFSEKQWAAALFGSGLVVMAILNKGCCATGGCGSGNCNVPTEKVKEK